MPVRRQAADRSPVRWERQRAWAASIFGLGLLLFLWPFVRTPPLPLGLAYVHLLAAWVLVVAALGLMARSLGRDAHRRRDDDE